MENGNFVDFEIYIQGLKNVSKKEFLTRKYAFSAFFQWLAKKMCEKCEVDVR